MREALSALTTRGRAFIAAGLTALVCAIALGQDELVRVGALLVLVPLATAWFLGRSRYRLGLVRSVTPAQVTAGQQTRVQLELTNDGRMPTGLLLLEDQIPYLLGTRPRFVIDRMGPRWKRSVGYLVRSDVRGKYVIGPMRVRLSDPFGMVELDRTFRTTSSLVVTPRVVPLPAVPLSGVWTGSGDNRPRAFASGSAEDVTVREYRRGDDLRRVHWRSSAHAGELMVRREEQPWQSRATLFLDNRKIAHRGAGAASSLEHAVSLAASIAVHLVQRGFVVRLVTASGEEPDGAWHERGGLSTETAPLLESLAVVTEVSHPHLDVRWLNEPGHSGLLVAVLGAVGEHDKPALSRMRHAAANAMAVTLDVNAWTRSGAPVELEPAGWLASRGWRAVAAGPADPLPAVWQELGRTGRTKHVGRDPLASLLHSDVGAPVPAASDPGAPHA
ncbi:MAG: DUF58 domain-containing protein [Nocardioidaceae bacterium]